VICGALLPRRWQQISAGRLKSGKPDVGIGGGVASRDQLTVRITMRDWWGAFPKSGIAANIRRAAAFLLAAFLFYRHAKTQVVVFHHREFGLPRAT
jgi:hypothetical protein